MGQIEGKVVLTTEESKQRRKAGVDAMSSAEKIHRDLTGGRPPASELRTPAEAVTAARVLYRELQSRINASSEPENSFGVAVAYVSADLSMAYTYPYRPGKEADAMAHLTGNPVIMIGLIFMIEDTTANEPEKRWISGLKPFLVTNQAVAWLRDLATQQQQLGPDAGQSS